MLENEKLENGLPVHAIEEQRAKYLEWWEAHGPTPAGLAWNKGKQAIRFDVLLDFFDLEGRNFLDVGCGCGDLNRAIEFTTANYHYHGLDITEPYLEEARRRYPGDHVTFQLGEFLGSSLSQDFDLVLASGTFNFAMDGIDQYECLRTNMEKMFRLSSEGIALDMLSDQVNFQREGSLYYSPMKVLEIALSLSRNVQIRHDYLPFEFAIAVFKDDSFDEQSTIFMRHIRRKRSLVEAGIL